MIMTDFHLVIMLNDPLFFRIVPDTNFVAKTTFLRSADKMSNSLLSPDIFAWLEEQGIDPEIQTIYHQYYYKINGIRLIFKSQKDLVMFKMRWFSYE